MEENEDSREIRSKLEKLVNKTNAAINNNDINTFYDCFSDFRTFLLATDSPKIDLHQKIYDLINESMVDFSKYDKKKNPAKVKAQNKLKSEFDELLLDNLKLIKKDELALTKRKDSDSQSDSSDDSEKKKPIKKNTQPVQSQAKKKFAFQQESDSDSDSDSSNVSEKQAEPTATKPDLDSDSDQKPKDMDEESDWDPTDSEDDEVDEGPNAQHSLDDRMERRKKWLLTEEDRKQNEIIKAKTEKKKRIQKETKRAVQMQDEDQMLDTEEAEKIVKDFYDVSRKDKQEQSKIQADLAKVAPIHDNLRDKYKIQFNLLQVGREFTLHSMQDEDTGNFTVSLMTFERIFELMQTVVGLINVSTEFDKLVETDIAEVLIEEQKREDENTLIIPGGICSQLEKLDKEQQMALNVLSTQKQAYHNWMGQEQKLLELQINVHKLLTKFKSQPRMKDQSVIINNSISRVLFLRLSHIYQRSDEQMGKLRTRLGVDNSKTQSQEDKNLATLQYSTKFFFLFTKTENHILIKHQTEFIMKFNQDLSKSALLYQTQWLAENDYPVQAQDILCMMNLSDKLDSLGRDLRYLFNRVLAVLGMAQFRQGKFSDCYTLINKLMSCTNADGRPMWKDLIGQANSDPAVVKMSPFEFKKTLAPYHLQINADLLRYVQFITCIFKDYPILVQDRTQYLNHFNKVNSENFETAYINDFKTGYHDPNSELLQDLVFMGLENLLNGEWEEALKYLGKITLFQDPNCQKAYQQVVVSEVKKISVQCKLVQSKQMMPEIDIQTLSELTDISKDDLKLQLIQLGPEKIVCANDNQRVLQQEKTSQDVTCSKVKQSVRMQDSIYKQATKVEECIKKLDNSKQLDFKEKINLQNSINTELNQSAANRDKAIAQLKQFVAKNKQLDEQKKYKDNLEQATKQLNNFWKDKEKHFQKI